MQIDLDDPAANPLAGDDLDAELASLVADLDAPIRTQGGLPATLASTKKKNGKASALKKTKQAGGNPEGRSTKGQRRAPKGGVPPAWLVDVSGVDFQSRLQSGTLSKLSVKELKSFLYPTDQPLTGNKQELAERVGDVLNKGGGGEGGGGVAGGSGARDDEGRHRYVHVHFFRGRMEAAHTRRARGSAAAVGGLCLFFVCSGGNGEATGGCRYDARMAKRGGTPRGIVCGELCREQ